MQLKIKRVSDHNLDLPSYATEGSAAMDLRAAENVIISSGKRMVIPTGFALEIPKGYEGQIRPRSGFSKYSIIPNSPGTIDSDYRGEVKVALFNHTDQTLQISVGDRIAQLVIAPVIQVKLIEVDELSNTERGSGGFGHTGTK